MKTFAAYLILFNFLISTQLMAQQVVTYSGGDGVFQGEFRTGSVLLAASGTVVDGSFSTQPNSQMFTFENDQIVPVTDIGDFGASVSIEFSNSVFTNNDYFFLTNVAGENGITIEVRNNGQQLDANWRVVEFVGNTLQFADDGNGINSTVLGMSDSDGGILVQLGIPFVDQIIVSWVGGGPSNRGLQFGLVASNIGVLGDVNCDGEVNLLDVAPFVEILTGGIYSEKSDINQDGAVDLLDVAPFVDLLTGG